MSRNFKTEGIVIRRVNLGEADQILTLLTPESGKISCLAKGSRRITSRFCGRAELFHHIQITAYRGRDLGYLNEAEVMDGKALFDLDLKGHGTLGVIAEITNKLIQDDQQVEGVYALLTETLFHLKDHGNAETILSAYMVKLLTLLGFMAIPHESKPVCALQEYSFPDVLEVKIPPQEHRVIKGVIETLLQNLLNSPLKSGLFLEKIA